MCLEGYETAVTRQPLPRFVDRSCSIRPAAGIVSILNSSCRSTSAALAGWIVGEHDVTAGRLLNQLALRDQVIEDILCCSGLLQLSLHRIYRVLHLIELQHLLHDGLGFDALFLLLLLDLALCSTPFASNLKHRYSASVDLYTNEEEDEHAQRWIEANGNLQETCVEAWNMAWI